MHVVQWQEEGGHGLEHLVMDWRHDGVHVESVVIGQRFGALYGLNYRIECDSHWVTRSVTLALTGGSSLLLRSNGAGRWHDGQGRPLDHLDGCFDIDISATPFTHTLPLQRLKLANDARQFVRVAHVSVPDLEVRALEYAYTCVSAGHTYLCEATFRDAGVTLKVDQDGIVLDDPPRFKRTR